MIVNIVTNITVTSAEAEVEIPNHAAMSDGIKGEFTEFYSLLDLIPKGIVSHFDVFCFSTLLHRVSNKCVRNQSQNLRNKSHLVFLKYVFKTITKALLHITLHNIMANKLLHCYTTPHNTAQLYTTQHNTTQDHHTTLISNITTDPLTNTLFKNMCVFFYNIVLYNFLILLGLVYTSLYRRK